MVVLSVQAWGLVNNENKWNGQMKTYSRRVVMAVLSILYGHALSAMAMTK